MKVLRYTSLDGVFYVMTVLFIAAVVGLNFVPTSLML